MQQRLAARGALWLAGTFIIALVFACGTQSADDPGSDGVSGSGAGSGVAPGASGGETGTGTGGGTPDPSQNDCAPSRVGRVTFSVPSGTFQDQLTVELTAAPGAEVRYTLDRTEPTANSPLYAAPVVVTATTQIRARAFVAGAPDGDIATAVYVARAFDETHDVPVLVLDAYGQGELDPESREFEDVAFLAWSGNAVTLSGAPEIASHAGYHVRGQSSSTFEKAPYRVELRDGVGDDLDCPLLGMPAESDWALIGPFTDKALIRNVFVYELGRDMGLVAPRVSLAEVYLNFEARPLAETDYVGVYQVVETIKNQKNRLDLKQLKEEDTALPAIRGGYIFKFEWLAAEEPILVCPGAAATCWNDLEVVDPDPLGVEQNAYLTQHLGAFNDVLHSASIADPTTGIESYLDVPSFVNHVIVNEITRNMDGYIRSQYFHKDRDGKIVAGPLWDFDLTMGVGGYFENTNIEGWQYERTIDRQNSSDWFRVLMAEPTFAAAVATRYRELRQTLLSDVQIDARIAELTAGLGSAAERNFTRWPNLAAACVPETAAGPGPIGPGAGPCPLGSGPSFQTSTAATWEGQVQAMRDWLVQRMAWLDTVWL